MKQNWIASVIAACLLLNACDDGPEEKQERPQDDQGFRPEQTETSAQAAPQIAISDELVTYTEERELCIDRNPMRNAYFGDLHVHTTYSFDAWTAGVRTLPKDAYDFARGEEIDLPPYDADGNPLKKARIDRPLDFTAVTDHSEYLGELVMCTEEGSFSFDTPACQTFRGGGFAALAIIASITREKTPKRLSQICGEGLEHCYQAAETIWAKINEATEAAYDRSENCSFTALHGYEHTGAPGTSNYHRNVIFRSDKIPDYAVSYVDAPSNLQLFAKLKEGCIDGIEGCDVISIPHNSNLSNGKMFDLQNEGLSLSQQLANAQDMQIIEPAIEIFQHKGNSECINGLLGVLGAPDELCKEEQVRKLGAELKLRIPDPTTNPPSLQMIDATVTDCADDDANPDFGMLNGGCISRNDFVRGILLTGIQEGQRLGINPYKYGIIASTDTHMSTPGATSEASWQGHVLEEVASFERRLGNGFLPSNLLGNPGGVAGVWAMENSRDAIFEALQRREVFGTTGPRISPRFFGGWTFTSALCAQADMLDTAYAEGVAMGGDLQPNGQENTQPTFLVAATRDLAEGANKLQRLQVIKGWITEDGTPANKVFDVAGSIEEGGTINGDTGTKTDGGADAMCTVFTDPEFDPTLPSYYYMRVVENPSLRWSQAQCLALPEAERPTGCINDAPKIVHEMAWSSPIWYDPTP